MAFSFFKRNDHDLPADDFLAKVQDDDVVLDVRTPGEYAGGHLAGAENIDLMASDFRERIEGLDRDRTYYLYCRSGNRSGQAAQMMRQLGFERAYNVGGFETLAKAGAETARGDG